MAGFGSNKKETTHKNQTTSAPQHERKKGTWSGPRSLKFRKAKWIISPNLGDHENDWNSHLVVSAEAMCRYWGYMLKIEVLVLSKATCDEFSSCTWCGTVQHWPSLGKWRRPTYMNICTYDGPILQVISCNDKTISMTNVLNHTNPPTISRCPCYPLHASTTPLPGNIFSTSHCKVSPGPYYQPHPGSLKSSP